MKKGLIFISLLMLVLMMGSVMAAPTPLSQQLKDVWNGILDIGSLKSVFGNSPDNQLIGFIRIAMAIIILSLLNMGLFFLPSHNTRITIAIILAIISAVFMPAAVLSTFAETYATIFALIIIFAPIAGAGYLLLGTPTPSRAIAGLKALAVLALFWLVNQIGYWSAQLVTGTFP